MGIALKGLVKGFVFNKDLHGAQFLSVKIIERDNCVYEFAKCSPKI